MILHQLATDYDGTIATGGAVSQATVAALRRVRASGRKILLITGRILADVEQACPLAPELFDVIVGENGGVLRVTASGEERVLGSVPEPQFLDALAQRGVPFMTGRCSVHVDGADAEQALAAIRETGVDRTLTFNRGSLMLLPTQVTKASGLQAALAVLGSSVHNTAGIGDGENDHAFLAICELAVAVGDAVPALAKRADYVTRAAGPAGTREFVEEHLLSDAPALIRGVTRHHIRLGTRGRTEVLLPVHGANLLAVTAPCSEGQSLVPLLIQRLAESGRCVVLIDRAGQCTSLHRMHGVVALGRAGGRALPSAAELDQILRRAHASVVLDLSAVPPAEQVPYMSALVAALRQSQVGTGLPHWLVIDAGAFRMPESVAQLFGGWEEGLCLAVASGDLVPPGSARTWTRVLAQGREAVDGAIRGLGWTPTTAETALLQHRPSGDTYLVYANAELIPFNLDVGRTDFGVVEPAARL